MPNPEPVEVRLAYYSFTEAAKELDGLYTDGWRVVHMALNVIEDETWLVLLLERPARFICG